MKTFGNTLAVLLGTAFLSVAAAGATEVFRAHYEIRVATQGTDNKVRSTFETRPGERFTLNLPPNVVAMAVRRLNAENYELEVTVTPAKAEKSTATFSHTYQGILGRPLELKNTADGVNVDGAISVVVLNR
ncbi:hypothetical protein GCM10011487_58910 [Steroidobacter agaridevorans]|uniref:Uncharacterized protein n=1 Tax=Steroidobacter agaridevorans TaxID=2695856 RepID=A0A829YLX7_9GAMM|nr:hypothetical protein [Steroidobacter agaridevorans]GFE83891.1 hypothetical protein GCM10011487_58910 [Steroidobacter agaridevorans]GFE91342.1 hypothetical protein GCM10011488_62960 [Steroidobacter agaridevorans]